MCDFTNLEREVRQLEAAGASALHLDVMDGCFVKNFTYGMPIVEAFRRLTELPLDVHLMVANPERQLEAFYEAGADILTIHVEATDEPAAALQRIRELGAAAGIALNPATSLSRIEPCLPLCDVVLVMSVEAGYGGQKFNPSALDKLRHLRGAIGDETLIEVDGGINQHTIAQCAAAGAHGFVVGSAIFQSPSYPVSINELTSLTQVEAT